MSNEQPSLLKTVLFTMLRVTGFMLAFFFLGGPYYTLLDTMFDAAIGQGIADVTTFSTWVYWAYYYAFPSLMVFGIIISVVYMFLMLRKRYYSSEEGYF